MTHASVPNTYQANWRQWGGPLDPSAVAQMKAAAALPVAVRGALMPDAHTGYGLPIGGVLATANVVIPYAVGVDIACRMRLSVLDLPPERLDRDRVAFRGWLRENTRFGVGAGFTGADRADHPVMDDNWAATPVTRASKDKAWDQLGTSGSGNHFVEFGILTIKPAVAPARQRNPNRKPTSATRPPPRSTDDFSLPAGRYLALLSHSGSRGTGSDVAGYYSRLAMDRHRHLPPERRHLAWLDLDADAGREYWTAMELMGRYAAANHDVIHRRLLEAAGAKTIAGIENHHNFAWIETHDGRRLVVHRKGATPAGAGVLGIIPGSMATPGFVVRGRGNPASLNSAAHGAGRAMSRRQALKQLSWTDLRAKLERAGVELLDAGLDEAPMAYKNIQSVMRAQSDLVDVLARFDPRLVLMAGARQPFRKHKT